MSVRGKSLRPPSSLQYNLWKLLFWSISPLIKSVSQSVLSLMCFCNPSPLLSGVPFWAAEDLRKHRTMVIKSITSPLNWNIQISYGHRSRIFFVSERLIYWQDINRISIILTKKNTDFIALPSFKLQMQRSNTNKLHPWTLTLNSLVRKSEVWANWELFFKTD